MKRLAGVLLIFAATAIGAELAGKWSGNVEFTTRNGELRQDTVSLELKTEGQALTGSIGRDADHRFPIQSGKVDGPKVSFEIVPDEGPMLRFNLTLEGERLHGTAKGEEGDRRIEVKLDLKKST
jgi:hypothetical protein